MSVDFSEGVKIVIPSIWSLAHFACVLVCSFSCNCKYDNTAACDRSLDLFFS